MIQLPVWERHMTDILKTVFDESKKEGLGGNNSELYIPFWIVANCVILKEIWRSWPEQFAKSISWIRENLTNNWCSTCCLIVYELYYCRYDAHAQTRLDYWFCLWNYFNYCWSVSQIGPRRSTTYVPGSFALVLHGSVPSGPGWHAPAALHAARLDDARKSKGPCVAREGFQTF